MPKWAQATLHKHVKDQRDIKSRQQLEAGTTGDPFWDAAQQQLRNTGELHNNVRMTWGELHAHAGVWYNVQGVLPTFTFGLIQVIMESVWHHQTGCSPTTMHPRTVARVHGSKLCVLIVVIWDARVLILTA